MPSQVVVREVLCAVTRDSKCPKCNRSILIVRYKLGVYDEELVTVEKIMGKYEVHKCGA
jgi:hypothetical protein